MPRVHRFPAALIGAAAFVTAVSSPAEPLTGLTINDRLITFDSLDPCAALSSVAVDGLEPDEKLLGIDYRPATGQLYGLGSTSRLYTLDVVSGTATAVAGPFAPVLDGSVVGFDFNPTVDRIRVVTDAGQNLRLNPVTGAVAATDTSLAYSATDANAGEIPAVAGAGYTNPDDDPLTGTALYDIDTDLDVLVTQSPPNNGTLNTVGPLGMKTNSKVGFDIAQSGVAYASVQSAAKGGRRCGTSTLVTIDLATGAATSIGTIGVPQPVVGLAAPTP